MGTPLECLGFSGYTYKLIFYMAVPPVLVLIVVLGVLYLSCRAKSKKMATRARTRRAVSTTKKSNCTPVAYNKECERLALYA